MIKNQDIIITGLQAWDVEIGSNCKSIALEFSKNNRVLYVNSPLDRKTYLFDRKDSKIKKRISILKGKENDLIEIKNGFWNLYSRTLLESISQLKPDFLFNYLNKINNKRFAKQIKKAINRLGFKDYILFVDSDMYRSFYLKELLKPKTLIYYTRDNLIAVDWWKAHGANIEAKFMHKADIVACNSTFLQNYGKKFNKNTFYIGQGCDDSFFNETYSKEIPLDMVNISRPIVGYLGFLTTIRLDISLLEYIAEARPDWSIVLAGPEDNNFKKSRLHNISNVFFLGPIGTNQRMTYINSFDVAINPQIINEITIGNYPLKVDEYLAMGKPVVATKTKAMDVFEGYTYQPTTKIEYIHFIEKALSENSPQKEEIRKNFARTHSWENSLKELYKAIELVNRSKL